MTDPFAQVQGQGFARLRAAGIEVQVGICESEARSLNAAYIKRLQFGRPWVIAKWAMSMDGKIATSTAIASGFQVKRREVSASIERVDGCIIVGGGTALADDPTLTARPAGPRQATSDRAGWQAVAQARCEAVSNHRSRSGVACSQPGGDGSASPASVTGSAAATTRGAVVGATRSIAERMVAGLLAELGTQRMTNVLVEGGGLLLDSFFQAE